MIVVAGPPGSGNSLHFPVEALGGDGFNVDVRAAARRLTPRQGQAAFAISTSSMFQPDTVSTKASRPTA